MKKIALKEYNVYTINELQTKYKHNGEYRDFPKCKLQDVPSSLRPIVKYANKWAIRCDASRHAMFENEGDNEITAFFLAVNPYSEKINEWLHGLPNDVGCWSESAVNFLYLLKALSEAYQPSVEEQKEIDLRRSKMKIVPEQQKIDIRNGLKAYRDKDYKKCRDILSKYENELEGEILIKFNKCKCLA